MSSCEQPGLTPLDKGIQQLLSSIHCQTKTEVVSLENALDRVIATDSQARYPVPGFDNAAMDGYAICLADITAGKPSPIQGTVFAGQAFPDLLKKAHAIRIMTGAPIPEGADTVIMQENTTSDETTVTFKKLAEQGNNVRRAGEDISVLQTVVAKNTKLNAAHLALLASVGVADVEVYQKTIVGIITTGSELKTPGQSLEHGEIFNSNGPAIQAMLTKLNVDIKNYGIIKDDPDQFRHAFIKADKECDFVISSGGVSVGEADYTKVVLEELGEIHFWKLAIKPGKPFAFGKLPASYFIGLPGNPVSAIVTFHLLASQAIRKHQNIDYQPMQKLTAVSRDPIRKTPGRMDFQRGHWRATERGIEVSLTHQRQASHMLTTLAEANCYIALEQDRGGVAQGEQVTLWLFDDLI